MNVLPLILIISFRNYIRLYTKNKILSYKNKSRRSSILVKVILNFYNQA